MSSSYNGGWNPWHGCTKISEGCLHCYVYRGDEERGTPVPSSECRKTASFDLPMKKSRGGSWKIPSGSSVYTCFTSDFLLKDADGWRGECWEMMKERQDLYFIFFTKRIGRLHEVLPPDWGDGYGNVCIGCTVENMKRAAERLPVFLDLPIRHRVIVTEPLLERLDIREYLIPGKVESVLAGGESGRDARICDFDWIRDLSSQCAEAGIGFHFHQTGAHFVKDGKLYDIPRKYQHSQAAKAGVDLF